MRMRVESMLVIGLLSFVCLLGSCEEGKKKSKRQTLDSCNVIASRDYIDGEDFLTCNLSEVKDTFNISLSSLVSSLEVVRLENSEEAFVDTEGHTLVSDNYIGIYSVMTSQYKLFGRDGKFLNNIGTKGQGPNEYYAVYDSYIDEKNNRIFLFPWMDKKILVFDLKGNPLPTIPLPYLVHKGKFQIDVDKKEITILVLPFSDTKSVVWRQDFNGNLIQEVKSLSFVIDPRDYSNEVYSWQNTENIDFSLSHWEPKEDTLYQYKIVSNVLQQKLTIKFGSKEIVRHFYVDLPNHYLIKLVNPQFPDESGQFITPRSPQIIIDKSSLKGCYCNLKIDLLGNIDGPAWTTYNRGYFIANIYPEELKAQIKRSLLSPALLSPAIKQKISNLNKIITEDDNNIILIGKLKESLLNSIEK